MKHTSKKQTQQSSGDEQQAGGIMDYWRMVANNRPFMLLLVGEIFSQTGNEVNYIATMSLVHRLSGGSAMLIGFVVIIRVLPILFLFPIAGVVADKCSRINVLVWSCLIAMAAVGLLPLVQTPGTLWLMFALLGVNFGTLAFRSPARRALIPQLVPREQLHLAATLQAFVYSLIGVAAASLGGFIVSTLGSTVCFLFDALTYLIAAASAFLVSRSVGGEAALRLAQEQKGSGSVSSQQEDSSLLDTDVEAALSLKVGESDVHLGGSQQRHSNHSEAGLPGKESESGEAGVAAASEPPAPDTAMGALRQAVVDLKEGYAYVSAPGNRDVLAFVIIRPSGNLIWGACDVLYVKFSEEPSMQVRDASTTLGLLFAGMGLGALLGPFIFNPFTPPKQSYILRSCAAAFILAAAGYASMTASTSFAFLLPSVVLRAIGNAVLWIYAILLVQYRVPNDIQGRVFSWEMALFVCGEMLSATLGGAAFDLGLGTRGVAAGLTIVATALSVAWSWFAWKKWNPAGDADEGGDSQNGKKDSYVQLAPRDVLGDEEDADEAKAGHQEGDFSNRRQES